MVSIDSVLVEVVAAAMVDCGLRQCVTAFMVSKENLWLNSNMKVGVWLKVHVILVLEQVYLLARFNPIPGLFYSNFTFWARPVKFAHQLRSRPNPTQASRSINQFMPTKLGKARFETDRSESKSTQHCVSTCVGIFQLVSASVNVSWLSLTSVSVFQ